MASAFENPNDEFLQKVFDTIPTMLMVVDEAMQIQWVNTAAHEGLGLHTGSVEGRRSGEVLHCVHAYELEEGCGQTAACRSCVIRNAVNLAIEGGAVHHKRTCLVLVDGDQKMVLHVQVSAGLLPMEGRDLVLLTLENVEELTHLRGIVPLCRNCGATRDDAHYQREVAAYLGKYSGSDLSQGLCSECAEKFHPEEG